MWVGVRILTGPKPQARARKNECLSPRPKNETDEEEVCTDNRKVFGWLINSPPRVPAQHSVFNIQCSQHGNNATLLWGRWLLPRSFGPTENAKTAQGREAPSSEIDSLARALSELTRVFGED